MLLHQALHGYSGGHHLLATSMELDTASQLEMARLSDLSGSEYTPAAETYITGYPLRHKYYVLARTWYAYEVSRSNAVWTHSILIPLGSGERIPSLRAIDSFFRRPAYGAADYGAYRSPMRPHYLAEDDLEGIHDPLPRYFSELISAVYDQSDRPVLVLNEEPREAEVAIDLIWNRQWNSLRSDFSFCSGALNVRRVQRRAFDLQFSPRHLSTSRIRAQGEEYFVIDAAVPNISVDPPRYWSRWINSGFGVFCETYGNADQIRRSNMQQLYEIFSDWDRADHMESAFELISSTFPSPSHAIQLKTDWIRHNLDVCNDSSFRDDQLQKLWCRLLTDPDAVPFSDALATSGRDIITFALHSGARERMLQVLDVSARRGTTPAGAQIFEMLAGGVHASEIVLISQSWPHAAAALIDSTDPSALAQLLPGISTPTILSLIARENLPEAWRLDLLAKFLSRASDADLWDMAQIMTIDLGHSLLNLHKIGTARRAVEIVFSRNIRIFELALSPSEIIEPWQAGLYGVVLSEALTSHDADVALADIQFLPSILLGDLLARFAADALAILNFQLFPGPALLLLNALYQAKGYARVESPLWSVIAKRYAPWAWIDEWDRERWLARMFVEVVLSVEHSDLVSAPMMTIEPQFAQAIRSEMSNVYLSKRSKKRLIRMTEGSPA
jgi:hypothetical protein